MKTKLLCSTAILAICLVSVPSTAQEAPVKLKLQPPPLADLLEAKAESVVSLKLVLKVQQTMMGQSRDTERTSEIRGVLINDQGLVLTASDAFEGGMPAALRRMLGDRIEMKATPTDIQVMFGNEVEEYEARLVARDSNLGLAFVQIMDLEGREVRPVNLGGGSIL